MSKDDRPKSPASPRPNGEPYYIDTECPDCGTQLVLYDRLGDSLKEESDELVDRDDDNDKVWHDEWVCPSCLDGIHLDVPESFK